MERSALRDEERHKLYSHAEHGSEGWVQLTKSRSTVYGLASIISTRSMLCFHGLLR